MSVRLVLCVGLFVASTLLSGCSRQAEDSADAVSEVTQQPRIDWFQDSLDKAFTKAEAEQKPLFAYWGAEWCPYCKELEATIFQRDAFIRMSDQFIMVDMSNGDAEQILDSRRFNIIGLPTVIVFDPQGRELTRIPGGLDMEQYAAVLELTLNALRPVSDLVAAVESGEPISDEDWQLLAAYAWDEDRGRAMSTRSPAHLLNLLARTCPDSLPLAKARLTLDAAAFWLDQEDSERDATLAEGLRSGVMGVLNDPDLRRQTLPSLAYLGADLVRDLTPKEDQVALQKTLMHQIETAIEDDASDILNRASLLNSWADLATALLGEDDKPAEELVAWGSQRADTLLAGLNTYQQHAGVNSLWSVYYQLDLEQQARAALMHGIEVSRAPYYFMSGMGYVERKAGNSSEAIEWYRRAWDATRQPGHRARWGFGYVFRLLDLSPDNVEEIGRTTEIVLGEMIEQKRGLEAYARTLARLSDKLVEWSDNSEERTDIVLALRQQMADACAGLGNEYDEAPGACDTFLVADQPS